MEAGWSGDAAGEYGNAAGEYACQLLENGCASDARGLAPPSRAGRAASRREGTGVRSLLWMETQEVARDVAVERDDWPGSFEFRGKCVTFV